MMSIQTDKKCFGGKQYLNRNAGFTLVEILVVLAIMLIISATAFSLLFFGQRSFSKTQEHAYIQSSIRLPMSVLSKELRNADEIELLTSIPSPPMGSPYYEVYVHPTTKQLVYYKEGVLSSLPGVDDIQYAFQAQKVEPNVLSFTLGKFATSTYDETTKIAAVNTTDIISSTGTIIGIRYRKGAVLPSYSPPLPNISGSISLVGTPKVGNTMTYSANLQNAGAATFAWFVDGINKGSGTSYTLDSSSADKKIKVVAFPEPAYGKGSLASSELLVTSDLPLLAGVPTIAGTMNLGETLTVDLSGLSYSSTPSATPILHYEWYRVDATIATETQVGSTPSYVIIQADTGKKIYVSITASEYAYGTVESIPQDVFTHLSAPANFLAKPQNASKKIDLSWSKVADAKGYVVQYSTTDTFSPSTTVTEPISSGTTTSQTISNLISGTEYYFRIKSINPDNTESNIWSDVKSATPK